MERCCANAAVLGKGGTAESFCRAYSRTAKRALYSEWPAGAQPYIPKNHLPNPVGIANFHPMFQKAVRCVFPLLLVLVAGVVRAQDDDWSDFGDSTATEEEPEKLFYDTRVVNGHSTELLEKGTFDLRIVHRFGDAAVSNSGRTVFGLDNSTDIRIGFEYGITDRFMAGAGRSKGAGPYTELWDGFLKYGIMKQGAKMPLSLTVATGAFFTSMRRDASPTSSTSFTKDAHRFSYFIQVLAGRSFFHRLTLQLAPVFIWRNLVASPDNNALLSIGGVVKYNFYKKISFIAEYYYNIGRRTVFDTEYVNPLAAGIEIKTYAHNFQIVFMNSPGIGEVQFIPYTASRWLDGRFRFGFTISREF
jgi:hypothetical protein